MFTEHDFARCFRVEYTKIPEIAAPKCHCLHFVRIAYGVAENRVNGNNVWKTVFMCDPDRES